MIKVKMTHFSDTRVGYISLKVFRTNKFAIMQHHAVDCAYSKASILFLSQHLLAPQFHLILEIIIPYTYLFN